MRFVYIIGMLLNFRHLPLSRQAASERAITAAGKQKNGAVLNRPVQKKRSSLPEKGWLLRLVPALLPEGNRKPGSGSLLRYWRMIINPAPIYKALSAIHFFAFTSTSGLSILRRVHGFDILRSQLKSKIYAYKRCGYRIKRDRQIRLLESFRKVAFGMAKKAIVKMITVLAAVGIVSVSLAGCKKTPAAHTTPGGRFGMSASQMQQQEKTELAALVKAGTITKAQSDKIANALSNMQKGFGQRRSLGSSRSGSSSNWKNRTSGRSTSRSLGAQQFSPLSSLVKDGTLTQAQADAVTKALFSNRFSNNHASGTPSN